MLLSQFPFHWNISLHSVPLSGKEPSRPLNNNSRPRLRFSSYGRSYSRTIRVFRYYMSTWQANDIIQVHKSSLNHSLKNGTPFLWKQQWWSKEPRWSRVCCKATSISDDIGLLYFIWMVLIRVENFIAPFFLFSTIISEEGSNNDEYHQGRYKIGEHPSPSKEKKLGDSRPLILTTKQLFSTHKWRCPSYLRYLTSRKFKSNNYQLRWSHL